MIQSRRSAISQMAMAVGGVMLIPPMSSIISSQTMGRHEPSRDYRFKVEMPTDIGLFDTMKFPLVRRVFANQIAKDLVSVQPMSLPAAEVFYLDRWMKGFLPATDTQPFPITIMQHHDDGHVTSWSAMCTSMTMRTVT